MTNSVLQPGLLLKRNRLRKRRSSATEISPLHPTVDWFSSLPPAVQRKLFSKEECLFYTRGRDTVILDAADETLRRRSGFSSQLVPFEPRISDDETVVDWEDLEHKSRLDASGDMCDYSTKGFRWLEDEEDLDLKLDDYHEAIAATNRRAASASEPTKRPSRRKSSLSSRSIYRGRSSTSSCRPPTEPPIAPAVPPIYQHPRSPSFSIKHLRSKASLSSLDPRATHYQDPAARMKLRLYLASPQKFDEAVEFGFPSVAERKRWAHSRPMTSPQPGPELNRTFFHDDTPSLSGDDGDDGDEVDERDHLYDPRTPEDPVFQVNRPLHKASVDGANGLKPFFLRRQPEAYARGIAADREMTLHMTLTRPDLRSPEELQLDQSKKLNTLPLEPPELAAEPSPETIWDTLPIEPSKMKRLLRKLKLK